MPTVTESEHGFTLIELTIATGIVLMLSGLALASYQRFQLRAQSSESSNLGSIMIANEAFRAKWGQYAQAKRFPDNCRKGPQVWKDKDSGGFRLIDWKATGVVHFCYCLRKGKPENSNKEPGANANNSCMSGKNTTLKFNTHNKPTELSHGIEPHHGKVDITAIMDADLDGDKKRQAYFNTDENREIISDPYSAGESTF